MPTTCNIKQHDTKGKFIDTLTLNGAPVPLSGVTEARFFMRRRTKPYKHVNALGNITDAPNGKVEYQPLAADVEQAGVFEQEWQITFASGLLLTFPNNGYNIVNILRDIGPLPPVP